MRMRKDNRERYGGYEMLDAFRDADRSSENEFPVGQIFNLQKIHAPALAHSFLKCRRHAFGAAEPFRGNRPASRARLENARSADTCASHDDWHKPDAEPLD
jgi:hypothetical protein